MKFSSPDNDLKSFVTRMRPSHLASLMDTHSVSHGNLNGKMQTRTNVESLHNS